MEHLVLKTLQTCLKLGGDKVCVFNCKIQFVSVLLVYWKLENKACGDACFAGNLVH